MNGTEFESDESQREFSSFSTGLPGSNPATKTEQGEEKAKFAVVKNENEGGQ